MAQHDPFTLDLFGNTSLSSGLGLGVTAFPSTPSKRTATTVMRRTLRRSRV
jgi:hypothetical protein